MRIVIDAGCATWGGDSSVPQLIEQFDPDILYGFDPGSGIDDIVLPRGTRTRWYLMKGAVWTHSGTVNFREANLGGQVDEAGEPVRAYNLATFILNLGEEHEVIMKMDIEGGEYEVLPHLVSRDADLRLSLLLVEWHCEHCGYGIWNKDHPRHYIEDGETLVIPCDSDLEAWLERRNRVEAMMRCETREWTL